MPARAKISAFIWGLATLSLAVPALGTQKTIPVPVKVGPHRPEMTTPADAAVVLSRDQGPRVIWMEVTAYCPCKKCCGSQARGVTASGKTVRHNGGRFVAADTRLLPFGTRLSIPGYHGGEAVPVLDRGGAIEGRRLDVFFPTHRQALQWGRQRLAVEVQ